MITERAIDLSIFHYVKGLMPSFVTIVDAFPDSQTSKTPTLQLPTVSVDALDLTNVPSELGSVDRNNRFWAIDVFCNTKSQRDDFTYTIFDALKSNTIPVYDYSLGFPPTVVPQLGYLEPNKIVAKPIYVFRDLVQELYWRSRITFFTRFTEV